MQLVLQVKNLSKLYGVRTIIKNASFTLHEGECVALVGSNGVGKSTLLKIIAGKIESDTGEVILKNGFKIGYLEQEIDFKELKKVGEYLSGSTGLNIKSAKTKEKIDLFFKGFGLEKIKENSQISKMSGGEKSKLAIISLLLKDTDILLLDEPTNNLDMPALIWLEEFIKKTKKTAVIISHDRRFLDNLASSVLEIEWFKREVVSFVGSYTDYLEFKRKELEKQKYEYKKVEKKKKQLKNAIQKKKEHVERSVKYGTGDNDKMASGYHQNRATRNLSSQTKAIQSRVKQLPKLEKPQERKPLEIEINGIAESAKPSLHLVKALGGYADFKMGPITIEIPFGRRVAFLGKNGSGKSTLLKMISGEVNIVKGERKIGPSIVFGNIAQSHENLPSDQKIIDYLMEETGLEKEFLFNTMKKYGFDSAESEKRISTLSPGGRARLLIAGFAARSVNVLLLDEPTNHLDEEATNALIEVLDSFRGTVVLISHDRAFMDKARLDYVYLLQSGNIKQIPDISFYENSILADVKKIQAILN